VTAYTFNTTFMAVSILHRCD